MKIIPVILAGGSGKRLWPLSRRLHPKQFYSLVQEKSLLQETVLRLPTIKNLTSPIVICNKEHRFFVAEQLQEIGVEESTILVEPIGRNTAPAIAAASFFALNKFREEEIVLLVLPSDHVINDKEEFQKAINLAVKQAEKRKLVTFGVVPTKAHSGYGYIMAKSYNANENIFEVERFIEKPNQEKAKEFIKNDNFLWNSGMFVFKADLLIEELLIYDKRIAINAEQSVLGAKIETDFVSLEENYFSSCPNKSIDVALMEKTNNSFVVKLNAGWNDVGSWSEIYEISNKDKHGNVIKGDVITSDTVNSYIYAENHLIATLGIEDLIVIDTSDACLIASKNRAQDINKVVEKLEKLRRPEESLHRKVCRPWGSFDSLITGKNFQVKRITVKPKACLSLQSHRYRAEHWVVVKGSGRVSRNEENFILNENESTFIPIGAKHRLENIGTEPLEIIEVQIGSYLGEDDIERYEDLYGRISAEN